MENWVSQFQKGRL